MDPELAYLFKSFVSRFTWAWTDFGALLSYSGCQSAAKAKAPAADNLPISWTKAPGSQLPMNRGPVYPAERIEVASESHWPEFSVSNQPTPEGAVAMT